MRFHKNGLMGVAVTSGKFFDDQVYYVSGAPHAGSDDSMASSYRTGRVFFFHKDTHTGHRFVPDKQYSQCDKLEQGLAPGTIKNYVSRAASLHRSKGVTPEWESKDIHLLMR